MSLFDSIISETGEKFGLDNKAGSLLSALLALITDKSRGGFTGFLDLFNNSGSGDLVSSWVGKQANEPVSNEQLTSALGADTISEIAAQAGIDKPTAASALAFMTPKVVDTLTSGGVVPDETDLLSSIGNYISGFGGAVLGGIGATGAAASGVFDRIGTAATSSIAEESPAGDGVSGIAAPNQPTAFSQVNDVEEPASHSSILNWLLPLILLALAIILGYTFCGKSTVTTPTISNTNVNKPTTATNASAKTVDSSFRLEAKDGKYVVTGIVKDEATKKQIMDALNAEFGVGNVNFDGLKVDAAAKDFGLGWWANFSKMLPGLKDWKTGILGFTGATVTDASGLPQAALNQLKLLFATGWTLPQPAA